MIRISEDGNKWAGMDRGLPFISEGRSRSSGRGDRFLPKLALAFVILALGLLLTDLFRIPTATVHAGTTSGKADKLHRLPSHS
ncbi:MAG TPA: hypothetical protein VIX89_00105 [Bryobacteraceae bacterium]